MRGARCRCDGDVADGGRIQRKHPSPGLALQHPEHHRDQSDRGQGDAEEIDAHALPWRRIRDDSGAQHHTDHDEHLGGEHVAPVEVRRDESSDQGSRCDGRSGHGADDREGRDALASPVVVGDERGDGRDDEHSTQPLDDRPAEEEELHVRAQRSDQRARRVHARPDHERPATTPHVAQPRAQQHKRGHREGVEGDGALHRGDGGVEVGHHRRDRHVHHGAVEHHHELRGSEDGDDTPALHGDSFEGADPLVGSLPAVSASRKLVKSRSF